MSSAVGEAGQPAEQVTVVSAKATAQKPKLIEKRVSGDDKKHMQDPGKKSRLTGEQGESESGLHLD